MDMYDAQILALVTMDDDEEEESEYGYDSNGVEYTEEDARSSYDDDRLHAMREGD
jgi:hypothetical protein